MRNTTPRAPDCEACGQPTLLLRAEPHPKFANMLQRVFLCRCGAQSTDIVAQISRRPVVPDRATTAIQGA